MKLLSLPNLLSLSRVPLAAAFLFVPSALGRGIIVLIVAATDMADGYFARRLPSHDRRAGAIIDPITDKLFVLIAIATFAVSGSLSLAALSIILARDLFTTSAFFLLKALGWNVSLKSRMSGKTVTVLQLAIVLTLLFRPEALGPLLYVLGLASAYAIVDYSRAAWRQHKLARTGDTL